MHLPGTVIEIWCLKVHVHAQTDTQTDRMTNLLISSNVHYVHLVEITMRMVLLAWHC